MSEDERPVYSDTGYFTRGRAAYRRDPEPSVSTAVLAYSALVGVGVLMGVIVWFTR